MWPGDACLPSKMIMGHTDVPCVRGLLVERKVGWEEEELKSWSSGQERERGKNGDASAYTQLAYIFDDDDDLSSQRHSDSPGRRLRGDRHSAPKHIMYAT
jgi:hypothetical protein